MRMEASIPAFPVWAGNVDASIQCCGTVNYDLTVQHCNRSVPRHGHFYASTLPKIEICVEAYRCLLIQTVNSRTVWMNTCNFKDSYFSRCPLFLLSFMVGTACRNPSLNLSQCLLMDAKSSITLWERLRNREYWWDCTHFQGFGITDKRTVSTTPPQFTFLGSERWR